MEPNNLATPIDYGSMAEWTAAIITLVGIGIALWQFISYRKELKNKIFLEFRQRFKTDTINVKIFEFISKDGGQEPSTYEVYHFFGFYEELHKMFIDKLISINDLVYFFGYYYLKAYDNKILINKIKTNDYYWTRAVDLHKIICENKSQVLKKISLAFNHKGNVIELNKK